MRRRLPGVNLRPGSVKQARQEAGLSLAQVGKGQVTAPAIYLIETGRTRPSLPTLEHIARRTGKPVEFFLADPSGATDETQTRLAELESKVAGGRYEEAIALGRSLLDLGSSAYRLGRIRYFLAIAYLHETKYAEAAGLLAEARAHFEAINDGVMLAESMGAQAALAALTQRPDFLALAEKALELCRSLTPVPVPTEARLLNIVATAHLANHDWSRAQEHYQAAIESGGATSDLGRMATLYGELATAYQRTGQIDTASRYASRAAALLEVLRDQVSLARAESHLGLILLARGEGDAAGAHLERSKVLSGAAELRVGRSQVLLSLCELCLQEGTLEQAGEFAREALHLAEELHETASVAEAHEWLGRFADRAGDAERTDKEFALAIHGFEQLGNQEKQFRCHGIYAEILEKRGDVARAYKHMKKAVHAGRPDLLNRGGGEEEGQARTR